MIPASNSVITIIGQDDNGTTGESIIKISKSAMALFRPEYTKGVPPTDQPLLIPDTVC